MTNAEKLAKDTAFMVNSITEYCYDTDCKQCRFSKIEGENVQCKFVTYSEKTFKQDVKSWLESEVEEE